MRYLKQFEFELTNHCNAMCVFCPRSGLTKKGFMSFATFKAGVGVAKENDVRNFKISGFGEPTLHKELVMFLQYLKQEIPGASILLITNGQLLTPELFERLSAVPVDRINISFNGYDRNSYESQMKRLDFEQVVANLGYIAASGKQLPEMQIIPILSQAFTQDDIRKMRHFMESLGFTERNLKFQFTITSRLDKIEDKDLIGREVSKKREIICLAGLSTF
ncbi:MAG: radical SAM protein, partial [Candidatus Margulisbacteria bacterium]|nr:radical SAM protein [Candidatus Margulisiibacteriota bacterium]